MRDKENEGSGSQEEEPGCENQERMSMTVKIDIV